MDVQITCYPWFWFSSSSEFLLLLLANSSSAGFGAARLAVEYFFCLCWNILLSLRVSEPRLDTAGLVKMETAAGRTFLALVFFTSTGAL